LDSVQNFAYSLLPVKHQVTKIKTNHRRADVEKPLRQIRVFVKDSAKKLKRTNDAERLDDPTECPENSAAEMASDVISKFEYPTSLRSVCMTIIIICF